MIVSSTVFPDIWLTPTTAWPPIHQERLPVPVLIPLERTIGRFDHLDLDMYRHTMSPSDYQFFVSFVGTDAFGFTEEDLDDFYTPEY
jgi:hypothetical protein